MNDSIKSKLLTLGQYSLLLAFFIVVHPLAKEIYLIVVQVIGLVLGLTSILFMMKGKLKISPIPHQNAILIQNGPYKFVRHPMYAAIILFVLPACVNSGDFLALTIFFVMIVFLVLKLNFEEKLLAQKFGPDWENYCKNTYKLLPFVY